jgi:hypothetical protein
MSLQRARPENCLSDLKLERLELGELVGDEGATARAHLESCAVCREASTALAAARAQAAPAVELALERALVTPLRPRRRRWVERVIVGAAALAAGGAVVVGALEGFRVGREDGRLKGSGFALGVWVKHPSGQIEHASQGARLSPGDEVEFIVSTVQPGYLGVVSMDASGKVMVFIPEGERLAALGEGKLQQQPGGVLLDDTLGPERFVAVRCAEALPQSRLEAAARDALARAGGDVHAAGALSLEGCIEDAFPIEKVAR